MDGMMNKKIFFLVSVCIIFLYSSLSSAIDLAQIEAYGQLPAYRSFSISPDAKHITYLQRGDNNDHFVVRDMESNETEFSFEITSFNASSTRFLTNKYVLLKGREVTKSSHLGGKYRNTGALSYNLETRKVQLLLANSHGIHLTQTGLGIVVGIDRDGEHVYMPAYSKGPRPSYNLYKVSLSTGEGHLHMRGVLDTVEWFVDGQGKVLARVDYNDKRGRYRLKSKLSGSWETVYSADKSSYVLGVEAVAKDEQSLIFNDIQGGQVVARAISLIDGSISEALYSNEAADVDYFIQNLNGQVLGVVYSGFKPGHDLLDSDFNALYDAISGRYPDASIYFTSWSDDKKSVVFLVDGGQKGSGYYLIDTETFEIRHLADKYAVSAHAKIKPIRYRARDGLKIPALLTFPQDESGDKGLPLIVLPHSKVKSYDMIGFDWLAQYLAAKGYLVFQPNYRGSSGFGGELAQAGVGQWGRAMQDDISDGVTLLIESGYADADRVCILGRSYGGYSALAGGAFSSDLYRCVVSINGVSNLWAMMNSNQFQRYANHWVLSYWRQIMRQTDFEKNDLRDISPINFVDNFNAATLLLHGDGDTTIPILQSKRMYSALKKAGKEAMLVKLEGEDHRLSKSETRLQALMAIDRFLDTHNPAVLN